MRIAAILLIGACMPIFASDSKMTSEERAKVVKWMEESHQEFITAISGLTEEQWKWKSSADRWSVGEVAEHVVLAEASLFGNVKKALAAPENPEWETKTKGKTEIIERVMAPRLGKAQAPEAIVPRGGLTMAEAKARFEQQRKDMEQFAASSDAELKSHTVEHPFQFFNTLNAYQWLIYVPLHTMRHDKQIAEVKATAGYPK